MNVFFRVDASITIGIGHLMRCFSLAREISAKREKVFFMCRELNGHLCDFLERSGFGVFRLPLELGTDGQTDAEQTKDILKSQRHDVDWLIVDHYGLDLDWEKSLRPHVKKIMVIDDLASGRHECDLILNQNFIPNLETRYDRLVSSDSEKLLGPAYALLRPEFRDTRERLKPRRGKLERIFIFFGICEDTGETLKALEGIRLLHRPQMQVDVVVEESDPHQEEIKKFCSTLPHCQFHCQINNMAQFMALADLAIGAGGSTTWERCCLGLPALVTALADNQRELTQVLALQGAIMDMGKTKDLTPEVYADLMNQLTPHQLMKMSEKGMAMVDGYGGRRVIEKLYEHVGVK